MAKKKTTTQKPSVKSKTPRQKKPKVEEFMEIGGSPVPGITLRQVLRGHTNIISNINWSPNGQYIASPSKDESIRIWDVKDGNCVSVLDDHKAHVDCVAWSPDEKMLASVSRDNNLVIISIVVF
jgi:WD40 repeat protein